MLDFLFIDLEAIYNYFFEEEKKIEPEVEEDPLTHLHNLISTWVYWGGSLMLGIALFLFTTICFLIHAIFTRPAKPNISGGDYGSWADNEIKEYVEKKYGKKISSGKSLKQS